MCVRVCVCVCVCVCRGRWYGRVVTVAEATAIRPNTDLGRRERGGGGVDAANANSAVDRRYKNMNTDQHYYSTKKRGWIASLHFVDINYMIVHAILYTNNYQHMIIRRNKSTNNRNESRMKISST